MLDRLVQQALLQILQPLFEPGFSESSYGFRPGRHAWQAATRAKQYIAEGRRWVVDVDLEKFFDRVSHDILMSRVARQVKDERVLKRIRRYLEAGMLADGIVSQRSEGTPQGGPLSPLLSNILQTDLDRERERRGHRFCRYADDCNIYVGSQRAGEQMSYYRLTEARRVLEDRDGWIRGKLRCILWRQRKRPFTRAKMLQKRGLAEQRAWRSATNQRGPWWNAGARHMNEAYPKKWFSQLGLVSLLDTRLRFQCVK